jgi:DNA helicase MCM8
MHELVAFFSAPGGGGARLLSAVRLASQHYVLPVDADELVEASGSADLSVALEMQPLEALACISAAAHEALFSRAHALAIAAELLRGVADGELRQQLAAAAAEAMCGGDGGGVAYGGGGGDGGGGNGGGSRAGAASVSASTTTTTTTAKVAVRLHSYSASRMHVRDMKSSAIGRLVTLRGTVVRTSQVRPLMVEAAATCGKCGETVRVPLPDGRYAAPRACPTDGCRGRKFAPDRSARAACVDWQRMRLKEVVGGGGADAVGAVSAAAAAASSTTGRAPRAVDVELRGDLAGCCAVGDTVTVTGIVRVVSTGERATGGKGGGGGGGRGGGRGGGDGRDGGSAGGRGAGVANDDGDLLLVYVDAVSVTNSTRPEPHAQQQQQQEQQQEGAATAAGASALGSVGEGAGGDSEAAAAGGGANARATTASQQQQQQQQNEQQQQQQQMLQQAEAAAARAAVGVALTPRDLQFVLAFTEAAEAAGGNQLGMLAASLCPSIHGHELVKAGLVLALLGGVRKDAGTVGRVPVRGDAHVLLVGDPGLGKSHLLRAVSAAAPRGMYVCGNTATAAGLTVAVTRDPLTGDTAFEAGAVVLADRGLVCLDEFDKASHEQHQALLEAMEQQEVSVAKAGLIATLPARTAVIAAANPVGGHYDRGRTLCDNINLSPAMLSRFDLTFVLLDRPDAERDAALSEHVLAAMVGGGRAGVGRRREEEDEEMVVGGEEEGAHAAAGGGDHDGLPHPRLSVAQRVRLAAGRANGGGGAGGAAMMTMRQAGASTMSSSMGGGGGFLGGPSLSSSQQRPQQQQQLLPTQLLRKYIAYARAHVFPVLSDAAARVIRDFYLQLRAEHQHAASYGGGARGRGRGGGGGGGVSAHHDAAPVTARQLESLVRLAEARARADLRTTVTREDAEDAIEIARGALLTSADSGATAAAAGGGGGVGGFGVLGDGGAGGPTMSARGGGGGGRGGRAAEAERFVAALQARSRARADAGCDPTFEASELQALVVELRVDAGASVDRFLAQLNEAGELLKSGPGRFRVRGGGGGGGGGAAATAGAAAGGNGGYAYSARPSQSVAVSFGGGGGGSQFLGRGGGGGRGGVEEEGEEDGRGGGGEVASAGAGAGRAAAAPPSPPESRWW